MNLTIFRYSGQEDSTLGILFEQRGTGRRFLGYTLEDEHRKVKVPGETCIPAGMYKLALRTEGGFHQRYARRFGDMHVGMIELLDVPQFQFILIHCGNDDEDTAGCVLVGNTTTENITRPDGFVGESETAYKRIYPPIAAALAAGKDVWLKILDIDAFEMVG